MFQFRPFKNSDPPHLADIWRRQPPQRGMMQPMSSAILELCVFCKQTFDPQGLIVATQDGNPVGFVHAGFGPTERGDALDYSMGVTSMLQVLPVVDDGSLKQDLLAASEEYLRSRGARVLYGGAIRPLNPFYLGLYGGSEMSGVLASDERLSGVFHQNPLYRNISEAVVMHLELARLRPSVARELRLLKRETQLQENYTPRASTWWDANVYGELERQSFRLAPRRGDEPIATAAFWDIEPLASSWGIRTSGLTELYVPPDHRRRKLATYLLSEAFKQIRKRGVAIVEAHVMRDNEPAMKLYQSMGFTQVDTAVVYRREGDGAAGV